VGAATSHQRRIEESVRWPNARFRVIATSQWHDFVESAPEKAPLTQGRRRPVAIFEPNGRISL